MSPLLRKDGKLLRADSGALANSLCPPPCCEGGSCYANATATSRLTFELLSFDQITSNGQSATGVGRFRSAVVPMYTAAIPFTPPLPPQSPCWYCQTIGGWSTLALSGSWVVGTQSGAISAAQVTQSLAGGVRPGIQCWCGNPSTLVPIEYRSPRHRILLPRVLVTIGNAPHSFSYGLVSPDAYDVKTGQWLSGTGLFPGTVSGVTLTESDGTVRLRATSNYVGSFYNTTVEFEALFENMVRCGDPSGLGLNAYSAACPSGVLP